MEPEEDLDVLLMDPNGLDYAFQRLADFESGYLGAAEHSDRARTEAGRSWWNQHKDGVKRYLCQSETIRNQGALKITQVVFAALVQYFDHSSIIATYATVVLVKEHLGETFNDLGKDFFDTWCGDIKPVTARTS